MTCPYLTHLSPSARRAGFITPLRTVAGPFIQWGPVKRLPSTRGQRDEAGTLAQSK